MKHARKVALIAGGLRDIGVAAARILAKDGSVVLTCDSEKSTVEAAKETLCQENIEVQAYATNMESSRDVAKLISEIVNINERIDTLIIIADKAPQGPLSLHNEHLLVRGLAQNINAAYFLCEHTAKVMEKNNDGGSIVIICNSLSDADECNEERSIIGEMSLGALEHMTKSMACQWGPKKIRVNAICGQLKNPHRRLPPIPLRRTATAHEVAAVAAFLAGGKASFITGTIIPVDGGLGGIR
ncbi:MAG: SDR family oxidoreductase [Deltaproteobacteria bacterium]|nr:SDR family oxidoreductase [Deltaproteobacteria bacterium]